MSLKSAAHKFQSNSANKYRGNYKNRDKNRDNFILLISYISFPISDFLNFVWELFDNLLTLVKKFVPFSSLVMWRFVLFLGWWEVILPHNPVFSNSFTAMIFDFELVHLIFIVILIMTHLKQIWKQKATRSLYFLLLMIASSS